MYQIPSKAKAVFLLENTKVDLYKIRINQNMTFKNAQIHLYIKGHIESYFKMKLNVYEDESHNKILFSSDPITNQQITRSGDMYVELRFDFPQIGNIMSIGRSHVLELEIYDGYTYDTDNFVAIIQEELATQNFLGSDYFDIIDAPKIGAKCSFFFDTPNQSTERYFMCRINGSKLMNGIVLATEYSFSPIRYFYEATIQKGLNIETGGLKITYSNFGTKTVTTLYRKDDDFRLSISDSVLNRFFYDPATGVFYFYADHILSETDYAILEYSLHFTNGRGKYAQSSLNSGDVVYWDGRLDDSLSFEFSQQNNLQGILSISSSGLTLKNQDRRLNEFLSENDSFNNRQMKCWSVEGSIYNNKVEFVGIIRGITLNDSDCTFSVADPLASLDDQYNDNRPNTALQLAQLGGYTIMTDEINRPVPRVLGKISAHEYRVQYTGFSHQVEWFKKEGMIECIDVNLNGVPTTSNNRVWSCGFGPGTAATTQRDVTAVADITIGTLVSSNFTINNSLGPVSEWLPVGTCIVNNGRYGTVWYSDDTQAYVWPKDASFSAAADIIRHKVLSVIVERAGQFAYARAGEAYTCQMGAAGDLQIVFANSFETLPSVDLATALIPWEDKVYCVFMNDDADGKASTIVKDLLINARITTNIAFAPDQTPPWKDIDLAITVPSPNDSSFPTFREVVELSLRSSLGFLYFNNAGFIQYKSFIQPIEDVLNIDNESGFDPELALTQKNSNGFSMNFDMWDLVGGVDFTFSHAKRYPVYRIAYDMVKDFYKTENIYQVDVAVDLTRSGVFSFLSDYARLIMGRSVKFNMNALADHMDMYIGDDVVVKRENLIGEKDEAILRLVSTDRSLSGAKLEFLDLKKFPTL